MKKSLTTLSFILFLGTLALGQLVVRPQVGINFPSFTEEIVHGEFEGNVGYQFGADLQIGSFLYVQPGANFETKNIRLTDVGEIKTSRLNVPILIGYKLLDAERNQALGVRIYAGPNFAYNVSENLDDAFTAIDIKEDDIRSFQLSALVGAGLDISILFVDIGYKFGLSEYFEEDSKLDGAVNLFVANIGLRIGF